MDKRLRQLENQSIPDLSHQEAHWKNMQQLLQTGAMPAGKPVAVNPYLYWIGAVTLSAVLVYMALRPAGKKETKPAQAITARQTISPPTASYSNDTVTLLTTGTGNTISAVPGKPGAMNKGNLSTRKAILRTGNPAGAEARLAAEPQVATKTTSQDPKASLAAFFLQLEKPEQEFLIDNRKDTVIWGTDGTALLLPARCFDTKEKITIRLREFYSYQDLLTHQLNTQSDAEPLETAGMLHISATVQGQPIALLPGQSIRWFLPDTSERIRDMQLFTGTGFNRDQHQDAIRFAHHSSINWQSSNSGFVRDYVSLWVKVVDLRDLPFRTSGNRNYKGYFYINRNSDYSKSKLKNMLRQKYPQYDKIIIAGKRKKKEVSSPWIDLRQVDWSVPQYSIGDTTWLNPSAIQPYNLEVLDTLTYTWKSSAASISPSLNKQLKRLADKYSADIQTLGWISCNRFERATQPRLQYVVQLADSAANYYTVIVFDRFKSMLAGYASGTRVIFPNIPPGEKIKIISVGMKEGQPVAAITATETSAAGPAGLRFEPTHPETFRKQAAELDQ